MFFLILFALFSCTSPVPTPSAQKVTATIQKSEGNHIEVKSEKVKPITNGNVKERLNQYGSQNLECIAIIKTDLGEIKVRLYKDTPLHRANFILMAKNGCYDNTVFTRVSKQFMAQAGGTYDEEMVKRRNQIGSYTIPAEILPKYYHKQGVIAAARSYDDNPEKRSNPFQFYFVEGSLYNDLTLDKYQEVNQYIYPLAHRQYYLNSPGAAHLDGEHTVFGEIIEGYSIIPKITHVKTDSRDWPVTDIFIQEVIIQE